MRFHVKDLRGQFNGLPGFGVGLWGAKAEATIVPISIVCLIAILP